VGVNLSIRPSFFEELRERRDERRGYEYAEQEIREFVSLELLKEQRKTGRIANLSFSDPFERGWRRRWYELGRADAEEGRFRGREFKTHGYNAGWHDTMVEFHKKGWRHQRLDEEFRALREDRTEFSWTEA
jgi:hypothetical protein